MILWMYLDYGTIILAIIIRASMVLYHTKPYYNSYLNILYCTLQTGGSLNSAPVGFSVDHPLAPKRLALVLRSPGSVPPVSVTSVQGTGHFTSRRFGGSSGVRRNLLHDSIHVKFYYHDS